MDSGYGNTYFVPIHDGCVLNKCMLKYPFGGKLTSEVLASAIHQELRSPIDIQDVCGIKKQYPELNVVKSELAPGTKNEGSSEEMEIGHIIKGPDLGPTATL